MAFLIPKKPPSLPSTPSSSSSSYEEEPVPQATVTSCLYLKPDTASRSTGAVRQSLDKDVVLRRIRHRKWVNRFRSAETESDGWLDDAFSSP